VLRIAITKKPDGSGALSCTRAGGSVTWQNQDKRAAFFALYERPVTDAGWITIRSRRAELFRRWHAVPPGQKLELMFG
jgi:hypothetical protein